MTGLRQALAGYLDLRRGMGFKLDRDARLLAQFISYLEQAGSVTVTAADALAWATLPAGASPGWLAFRMSVARGFAAYLRTLDPAAEIIPPGLLPGGSHRAVPYLYSAADISALLAQAQRLRTPLRTATIQALIGLLAVTGMRIGEALALDDSDFDAGQGMLIVRHAKFGKRRLLPLHQTTVTALQSYQGLRGQVFPRPCSDALLVSSTGDRLRYVNVSQTFVKLARRAGLAARSGGCRPRPHDLRHSFAVATLLDWYRDGVDVASRLPLLSAYLGHVEPANTYWYLHAAPELLAEAARVHEAVLAIFCGHPQLRLPEAGVVAAMTWFSRDRGKGLASAVERAAGPQAGAGRNQAGAAGPEAYDAAIEAFFDITQNLRTGKRRFLGNGTRQPSGRHDPRGRGLPNPGDRPDAGLDSIGADEYMRATREFSAAIGQHAILTDQDLARLGRRLRQAERAGKPLAAGPAGQPLIARQRIGQVPFELICKVRDQLAIMAEVAAIAAMSIAATVETSASSLQHEPAFRGASARIQPRRAGLPAVPAACVQRRTVARVEAHDALHRPHVHPSRRAGRSGRSRAGRRPHLGSVAGTGRASQGKLSGAEHLTAIRGLAR